tara:strand:+ start:287 stop:559 length:273 start_codon:yes stop_codon:yes gene_type:complete
MQSNNKLIAFIGLFFLASISLHSFAHTTDNFMESNTQIECQACQNKDTPYSSSVILLSGNELIDIMVLPIRSIEHSTNKKPFHSQAPPKI